MILQRRLLSCHGPRPIWRARWHVAALLLLLGAAPLAFADNEVGITFDGKAIIASVKKGAPTVWLGISLEQYSNGLRLTERAFMREDDDHDGIVRVELARNVPLRSFWMVVDLKSGAYSISAPNNGAMLTRAPVPAELLHSRSDGAAARLFQAYPFSIALLVRPGVGAWIARIKDGSRGDGDGVTDGRSVAIVDMMVPVGSSPAAPDDLNRDDVVALIDPLMLSVMDGRVIK